MHPLDSPIYVFASGYNWREKLEFIKNRVKPSHRHKRLTPALPRESVLNPGVKPALRLGLIGDVMPIKDFRLRIGEDVQAFFKDTDYFLINLEGVITERKRFLALNHHRNIIDQLAAYFPPEKTILYCANNHAGDFGYAVFMEQYNWLKERFFAVIGAHDDAQVKVGGVNIVSVTNLSNQTCKYVAWLKEAARWHDPSADFNLLLPHWGYEMQLYPRPAQIKQAKHLLEQWDFIAGNHSHCPQPATAYSVADEKRAVVYSMGNFCYYHPWPHHRYGTAVQVEIGPNTEGIWQTGTLKWSYTRHDLHKNGDMTVGLAEKCRL